MQMQIKQYSPDEQIFIIWKTQVLIKMWANEKSHVLLVGKQIC